MRADTVWRVRLGADTVWRVRLGDETYPGQARAMLIVGTKLATVEAKALALAQQADKELAKGEDKHRPYIDSIERIGPIDGFCK